MSCMVAFHKSGSQDSTKQGVMLPQEHAALLRGLRAHCLHNELLLVSHPRTKLRPGRTHQLMKVSTCLQGQDLASMQPQSDRLWCKEPQAFIHLAYASCSPPRHEGIQHICRFMKQFDECKQLVGDDGHFDLSCLAAMHTLHWNLISNDVSKMAPLMLLTATS